MTSPMLLFVYGTLRRAYTRLPEAARQLNPPHILHTRGEWMCEAKLYNHALFDVGKYPGIIPSEKSVVHGDIFRVESSEYVLKILDEYEGIMNIYEEPYEYRRVAVEVVLEDGEQVRAWTYVYNWSTGNVIWIDNGDYVDYCLKRIVVHDKAVLREVSSS